MLAAIIEAPETMLPDRSEGASGEGFWITTEGELPFYRLLYFERGLSRLELETRDEDALLERVMDGVTFSLACSDELTNRRPHEDFRLQLFEIQERLMHRLNPVWAERLKDKHTRLLSPRRLKVP